MALLNKVRVLRERRGESLADVARTCGIGRTMVSMIELGKAQPSAEVMAKLARHFNVAMDDLFFLADELAGKR